MLDLFTIFTKGGIVLWCFRNTKELFVPSVNALIRNVLMQERTGSNSYDHNHLTLQYKLDNEFELVFVVAFQKILQLAYIDKFLSDIHLEFRDKYKNDLRKQGREFNNFDFLENFTRLLKEAEAWGREQATIPRQMRTFEQSNKSKKTVASMIERKGDTSQFQNKKSVKIVETQKVSHEVEEEKNGNTEDVIQANRKKMIERLGKKSDKKKPQKSPGDQEKKKQKNARVWELNGNAKDAIELDRSKDRPEDVRSDFTNNDRMVGQLVGNVRDLEVEESSSEDENDSSEEDEVEIRKNVTSQRTSTQTSKKSRGMFAMFKGLVGSKSITMEDMQPALDKLRDHLIMKNVATDIAQKLCTSVGAKLEGKVLGTFDTIAATVKSTLNDSLVQILSPKRRVDILRDCLEAKKNQRPYVMTFCGVNGVGKSTNLAKICFWLIENNLNVLIAACDTFRAGAVEQLRTHTRHLNALHPREKHGGREMVQLYEKGYGKDAAGIAMEAIRFAKEACIDIVLVDTAGRMQDNEPLMRALAKLIKVNEPDLVLFVGEALVGNEAVDQLVKFNQALADYSAMENPHVIDGIVLTKFDTIDDKVGAAISMTYITGQPIVFVGTGQTYTDLKALNSKAVVQALMK
ncbi:CLUMA_CG020255, isoform A [Clunio marinus]|uniref:CLUMA_CG020255, isoform A n=1 Tax=Clunio marinus TaxID=568069 RepID=A0A1J1J681_9DIPT|nr:CLUMA_CG020255, isoform A [Clunio marinus]